MLRGYHPIEGYFPSYSRQWPGTTAHPFPYEDHQGRWDRGHGTATPIRPGRRR